MNKSELQVWMDYATPYTKNSVAKQAGLSVNYLYLMASGRRENPSLRLALKLVEAVHDANKEALLSAGVKLPRVTLIGLAGLEFDVNENIVSQNVK